MSYSDVHRMVKVRINKLKRKSVSDNLLFIVNKCLSEAERKYSYSRQLKGDTRKLYYKRALDDMIYLDKLIDYCFQSQLQPQKKETTKWTLEI